MAHNKDTQVEGALVPLRPVTQEGNSASSETWLFLTVAIAGRAGVTGGLDLLACQPLVQIKGNALAYTTYAGACVYQGLLTSLKGPTPFDIM